MRASASAAGAGPEDLGVGRLVVLERAGDGVEVELAGGAGFGDVRERSLDAIDSDLAEGYATPAGAARDYEVVVGPDGKVDRPATARLRATVRDAAQ